MKHSTDRILTTHVGSLPRPNDLRKMWDDRLAGRPSFDKKAFAERVRSASVEMVQKTAAIGARSGSSVQRSSHDYADRPRGAAWCDRLALPATSGPVARRYADRSVNAELALGRGASGREDGVITGRARRKRSGNDDTARRWKPVGAT